MERISPQNPAYPFVSADTERLGGEVVFRGSRVPVRTLFDYLKAGYDLATFLDHFDGVTREQAQAVLDLAATGIRAA